jgi:hypothetical protein
MKLILSMILLITACGVDTEQETYLDDFLKEHKDVQLNGIVGETRTCWTENGNPTRFLMLPSYLSKDEVYAEARECLKLGEPANE